MVQRRKPSLPSGAVRRDDVEGAPIGRTHASKAERGKLCPERGLAWAEAWRVRSIGHIRDQRATHHRWKMAAG